MPYAACSSEDYSDETLRWSREKVLFSCLAVSRLLRDSCRFPDPRCRNY